MIFPSCFPLFRFMLLFLLVALSDRPFLDFICVRYSVSIVCYVHEKGHVSACMWLLYISRFGYRSFVMDIPGIHPFILRPCSVDHLISSHLIPFLFFCFLASYAGHAAVIMIPISTFPFSSSSQGDTDIPLASCSLLAHTKLSTQIY